jgi:hypothetical protein
MRNKRNQTGTAAVIHQTVTQLRTTIEQLDIAMRSDIPEQASDLIIGEATRRGIERLNVVRDEFGFDKIDVGEGVDQTSLLEVLDTIANKPIGDAEATHREVLEEIVRIARSAIEAAKIAA